MSSFKHNTNCCICLTQNQIETTTKLSFTSSKNQNSILWQLQNLIPEVEWKAESKICLQCTELVEKFTEFKKLCIESNLKQQNIKTEYSLAKVSPRQDLIEPEASWAVEVKLEVPSENTTISNTKIKPLDSFSDIEVTPSANSDFNDSDNEPLRKIVKPKRRKKPSYECQTCNKAFLRKNDLTKHRRTCLKLRTKKSVAKTVQGRFSCAFNCQQSFLNQNECDKHQKTCEGVLSTKKKRVLSGAPNIDRSTHACGACARRFTSQQVLTAHVSVCTGNTAPPSDITDVRTKCPLCNRVFATKNTFNTHFTTTHRDYDIQNMCQVCLTVFPTAQELTAHVHTPEEVATATQQQQQQCDTCHEVFDSVLELGKHSFTAHDTVWVSDATCEVCLEVFPSDADAVNHYKDAHGIDEATLIRPYLCWHCPARFSLLVFKTHVKYNFKRKLAAAARPKDIKEASDVRYVCDDCRKLCLTRNELELHVTKEHRDKYNGCVLIQCRHCAVQKARVQALYAHVRSRHMPAVELNADKPCLSCEVCDATFATAESVIEHSEMQHNLEGSTVTVYACPHCPFRCVTLATFKTHIATYFEEKARFVCSTCGAGFTTKQNLGTHEDGVHKKLTHVCETCGKKFKKKYLQLHIRVHHPELLPPEKQFKCNTHCDKSFPNATELQQHIDRINGVKNYACHACPRTFVREIDLNTHIRRIHSEGQTKKHECPACHRFYRDKGYMKLHMKKAHNLGSYKVTNRNLLPREYTCHLCQKEFLHKCHLDQHLDSHAGIKRFTCQFCKVAYATNQSLKAHLRKQHNFTM